MEWNGSRWWKFDFHTHTPASYDYGKGPHQAQLRQRTPRDWLLDYMRAEIDCVAVTDHNTGEWIDQLQQALKDLEDEQHDDYRKLYLFPGMEISVNGGIHVLAILDPSEDTAAIQSLRGAVDYHDTSGKNDGVTRKSLVEVVEKIVSASGIAIPAHVDGPKGLFEELSGKTLEQALDCNHIFAMELMNSDYSKPSLYTSKKMRWTEVLGSDSHHPSGGSGDRYPGSHYTWVKMGCPNIEGLRLALLDDEDLSVRRSVQEQGNPNEHASQVIESLEVSGARHVGIEKPFKISFNPWLNAMIGGRGSGKSTSVEFLRTALRREAELPKELKPEFEKYFLSSSNGEDTGLLTDDTSFKVIYRKDDARFRIQWSKRADLEAIEQEVDGEWRKSEGDIQQRFPIRIYSQKQIFELAKDNLALLKIVDDAPGVNRKSWDERWHAEEAKFLLLRTEAREMEAELAKESRLRGELDDVKRKLNVFETTGHADVLKAFQEKSRQSRSVETWEGSWIGTGELLRKTAKDIVPDSLDETDFDANSVGDRELYELAAKATDDLDKIRKAIEELALKADDIKTQWRKASNESAWRKGIDAAQRAYEDMKATLVGQGVSDDPAAYGGLVQERQAIEQQLGKQEDQKARILELDTQAGESLQRLLELRRELTTARRNFLDGVLGDNPYVQIRIVPYGAKESVEGEFRQLIHREGGGFERDIGTPDDGGLLSKLYAGRNNPRVIEANLAGIKNTMKEIHGAEDVEYVSDQRFAKYVKSLPPETFDRLDAWFPEDALDVQYSTTGKGKEFRSIQKGSPGQKTAALLAFLLSYGEEPLILDQPEDDLDNQLIYDLIVKQLRKVKRHRQIIVVTHNANIVVNGDAELVIALAGHEEETQKDCEGSLQEQKVRDTVCNIMEGGLKAFKLRYQRIAPEERHV